MKREGYRLRFEMKAAAGDEAEVMVYSDISSMQWWGDEVTPQDFDKALKEAKAGGATKLTIRVNSPGGEVYSAVAMRSMVINAGFESVRVMIEGLCASAATLFATIPGATVVIAAGSEFMIHNPATMAWGTAESLEKEAAHLRKLEDQFVAMYAEKTGHSEGTIREWMDAETWFSAAEAVENGFADELLEAEPVAACVSARDMEAMRGLYSRIPECIAVREEEPAHEDVSTEAPAGASTEITDGEGTQTMEIREITMDQLRAENPALFDQIRQDAAEAERRRQEDIDALTLPGYEAMAAEAKANGTTAEAFQRSVVQAMREKGAAFMEQRRTETEPAKDVAGGVPKSGADEEKEIRDNAEAVARYAKEYRAASDGGMY